MGIKKSDIAAVTGAATSAVKKYEDKKEKAKVAKGTDPIRLVNKSAQQNSAAGLGQNSTDQAAYDARYGAPDF